MKRNLLVIGALLLGLILTACSPKEDTKVKTANVLFIGSTKEFAKEDPLESVESEFEPWNSQNLLPYFNSEAPETVHYSYVNDLRVDGKYSGESKVCIPNTFAINKYEYYDYEDRHKTPYISLAVNNETGDIFEFVNKETKDDLICYSADIDLPQRNTEKYAELFLGDIAGYTIRCEKTNAGFSFDYYKRIMGIKTRNRVEISVYNNRRLSHLINYTTKEFEDWDKHTTKEEKNAFVQECSSDEVLDEMQKKLATYFKCDPDEIKCTIKECEIIAIESDKPAIYYILDTKVIPKEAKSEKQEGLYDFLVVYE